MEVQARAKWVRTSPRKVRLVAQTLRNLPVSEALVACQFMPRAAARDVAKVIRSAQANAENNFNLVRDDLVVKDIRVEPGPMLKRGQPRAMGRLFSVFKRTSHITAIVEDRPGAVRRRTATLPRAPQPGAATTGGRAEGRAGARPAATPAAAAAARTAGRIDAERQAKADQRGTAEPAATTESDEAEPTSRRRPRARSEDKAASTSAERGKKGEARAEGRNEQGKSAQAKPASEARPTEKDKARAKEKKSK
jgi:large subunit ribosomal protein L22